MFIKITSIDYIYENNEIKNMMMSEKFTIDHKEIKEWIEGYNGKPAKIDDLMAKSDVVGLRINFPGKDDEYFLSKNKTKDISWKEFFKIFEEENLAFIYQVNIKSKNLTMSYKFIDRDISKIEESSFNSF